MYVILIKNKRKRTYIIYILLKISKKFMKIDIKTIIIAILSFVVLGFIMFGGKGFTNNFQEERDKLQNQLDSMQIEKEKVDARIGTLEENYNQILSENEDLKNKNDSLSVEIDNQTVIYVKSKDKIKELNNQIDNLKENPPNREGDDLINSLRNKFN